MSAFGALARLAGFIGSGNPLYDWAREVTRAVGSGGGGGTPFLNMRVDLSVNSARVEQVYSSSMFMHCQTGGNSPGGFAGGGTGNKSIVGFQVGNGLPLGQLHSFSWTWLDLLSYISGFVVYSNLVLDVNGDGSLYKIIVIDSSTQAAHPNLDTCTVTVNPDGSVTTAWDATKNIQIVNGIAGVVPVVDDGPIWNQQSYRIADILAVYPNATLRQAFSGDGGLPANTITPAFMLVTGDSGNNVIRAFRITMVRFNGAIVLCPGPSTC
jgi:hypothetical protein